MSEKEGTCVQLMKAYVMLGIGGTAFADKPIPVPGPNDVVIKTTAALVCTSDCHLVAGTIGERHNLTLGHEAVGVVYACGEAVGRFAKGQRVAVNAITPCYRCHACQRGNTSQCGGLLGGWKMSHVRDGVFAEYFLVNNADANLALIPEGVSDEAACYTTDMISTGFKGVEEAGLPLGGTVAIFAQGPVGLMATAGARLMGAGMIIAVDKRPNRLELSKYYGADVTLNFNEVDPDEEILEITDGAGVDATIEAIGSQMALDSCVRVTRPGGTIVNLGIHSDGPTIDFLNTPPGIMMKELKIRSVLCPGGKERMSRLLRLIANNRVDPTKLTTHRFQFQELDDAFRLMRTKEGGIIKPLILF